MAREIPLTRGLVALVDDEDYATVVARGPWHAAPGKRTFYARHTYRDGSRFAALFMHTVIAGVAGADHVNGDGLDNRRANLRPASNAEQARNRRMRVDNTSGFKGVALRPSGRWSAGIRINRRQIHLGTFATAELAAKAYDAAARVHHGKFACLNFPTP